MTSVQNALNHWNMHKNDFPNLLNAQQYVDAAKQFVKSPPPGTLSKVRPNGDKVFYNPGSNTFAITDSAGVPRTLFKPDTAIHPYKSNLDYFNAQ